MSYKITQNNAQLFSRISKMKTTVVAIIFFSLGLTTIFCDDFNDSLIESSICDTSGPVRDVAFVRIGRFRKEFKEI